MKKIELPRPTIILGGGISSTGKTTFYEALVKNVADLHHLNKDTINQIGLMTVHPNHIDEKDPYFRNTKEKIGPYKLDGNPIPISDSFYQLHGKFQSYRLMLEIAAENARRHGKHSLLEGNYCKEIQWGYMEKIVHPFIEERDPEKEWALKFLWCHAPEDVVRGRLAQRGAERDQYQRISDEEWKKYLQAQPITPKELDKYDHLKIDTTLSQEKIVQQTIDYLLTN